MFYYTSVLFIPAHKCLFSISFGPHAPSLSHPTSPLFPSSPHPKGMLFADLLDWFLWLLELANMQSQAKHIQF